MADDDELDEATAQALLESWGDGAGASLNHDDDDDNDEEEQGHDDEEDHPVTARPVELNDGEIDHVTIAAPDLDVAMRK
jgi:hypothetical protein